MTFVDTNVLLYAISGTPGDRAKAERARAILRRDDLVVSVQVLQEFYVQSTRSSRLDALSPAEARQLIELWQRFTVVDNTLAVMTAALRISERHRISFWDAAIVAAAAAAGCTELLSEDLSPGHDYGGVRVVNPFA